VILAFSLLQELQTLLCPEFELVKITTQLKVVPLVE
jgi:hypothetical protein